MAATAEGGNAAHLKEQARILAKVPRPPVSARAFYRPELGKKKISQVLSDAWKLEEGGWKVYENADSKEEFS